MHLRFKSDPSTNSQLRTTVQTTPMELNQPELVFKISPIPVQANIDISLWMSEKMPAQPTIQHNPAQTSFMFPGTHVRFCDIISCKQHIFPIVAYMFVCNFRYLCAHECAWFHACAHICIFNVFVSCVVASLDYETIFFTHRNSHKAEILAFRLFQHNEIESEVVYAVVESSLDRSPSPSASFFISSQNASYVTNALPIFNVPYKE